MKECCCAIVTLLINLLVLDEVVAKRGTAANFSTSPMGLVRITSWYPNFNESHFGLPPSEIHRMTGLPPQIV